MANNIAWPAIHAAYKEYKGKLGQAAHSPTPQPDAHKAGYAMLVHAMSQTDAKPGEDHGSMIIRALSDHLKRMTPNIGNIHQSVLENGD